MSTSGSFTIAGNGGALNDGSGGTIQNTTSAGIRLHNTMNVSINYVNVTDPGTDLLAITDINGFTLNRCTISDSSGTASFDASLDFNNYTNGDPSITPTSVNGTINITNSVIGPASGSAPHNNLTAVVGSGTSTWNVTGCTFRRTGNSGINLELRNSAVFTAFLVDNCTFAGANIAGGTGSPSARGIFVNNLEDSVITLLTIQNSIFTNNNIHIDLNQQNDTDPVGSHSFRVLNNTMTGARSHAMNIFGAAGAFAGTFFGRVEANTIGNSGALSSGSEIGNGIRVNINGGSDATIVLHGNLIRQTPNGRGIEIIARNGTGGLDVTVSNNDVNPQAPSFPLSAILIQSNALTVANSIRADVRGNIVPAGNTATDLLPQYLALVQSSTSTFQLVDNAPASANAATELTESHTNPAHNNTGSAGTLGTISLIPGPIGTFKAADGAVSKNDGSDSNGDDVRNAPTHEALVAARGVTDVDQAIAPQLTQDELTWMAQAAIERWAAAGIPAEVVARLQSMSVEVSDLPGDQLAVIMPNGILFDETAAGYGWYFDATPSDDFEFDLLVPGKERQATELGDAHGKIDLLSALMREFGSVYLQGRDRTPKRLRPLMQESLSPGVRRLPLRRDGGFPSDGDSANKATDGGSSSAGATVATVTVQPEIPTIGGVVPTSTKLDDNRSGETVTRTIGTVPAGKTVTVTFRVTIDTPFPVGVCTVSNQGTITGSNFANVLTDDPAVGGAADPTMTTIPIPPVIGACPANITVSNTTGVCGAAVTFTPPTATGCPVPTVTCVPASGSTFVIGTTTVTCTAANSVLPNSTCSFTVTVNDTQAPTVTCPANITQPNTAGQCSGVATFATPAAVDSCPGATVVCVPASGSTFPIGVTTVTCTATDASANTGSCSFTVTINDTQAPTVACPANITMPAAAGLCSAVATYTTPTASDNCPGATVVCAPLSGSSFPVGVTTVTCTATDASANTGTCSFTVTIQDTQAPTVTCPANITTGNTAGQCSAVVNFTTPTAADNCPGATVVCVPASGATFPVGSTTVTCTATDASANTGSCSFTVTVQDTQAPTVSCPANITQSNTAGQCSAVVNYTTPTGTDNCPGPVTVVCVPASGATFPVGTTTVTCTASDGSANSPDGTCTFTVTINDTQAPTVVCPANITTPAAAGQCSAGVNFATPVASDNCPGATVVCVPASGSTFAVGSTTVTCTATDASSNTGSCSFSVTVNDTQAPTVTCPSNITVVESPPSSGSATVTYTTPTASDNCPGATVNCVPASGSSFPVGTTTVTCTATDASANTGTCTFTITVQPACTITCPANVTTPNDANQCGAVVNYPAPTTTGVCGTVTCVPASGSFFAVGTKTVNCSTTSGPTCSFTVTVNDAQAPVANCPAPITVANAAGQCSAVVSYTATASDNCPGATIACLPASGSTFPVGTTTVTCTATDAAANTGTCSFSVTVQDTQAPAITCPANMTVPKTAGQCSTVVNYTVPTATDNCPGATASCTPASGSTFPVGVTTVTCTATDASPNSPDTTCTFTITVTDTTAPVITCPANVTVPNDANVCGATVKFADPTTSDNCPGTTVTCVPASGTQFAIGTTTVTCTATDASNNTSSCSFTVTVQDTQAPVATCPAPITVAAATGTCSAVVNYTATATDNCPGVTLVCAPASGSTFPVGVTTVNCTATDATGNTATCAFTVTVQDTQLPVITCPANIVVTSNTTNGCTFTSVVNYPAPTATDNCGLQSVACVPPSGSTFQEGTTTVTCTATDTSGNTAACTFTVTVGAAFGFCSVDDATGNTFRMVVDPASPSYRVWRFTVVATNTTYCGRANYLSYIPGVKLRAYDNDYSAENPTYFMDANFKGTTGTVTVRNVSGTVRLTLRDRNLLDSVCP